MIFAPATPDIGRSRLTVNVGIVANSPQSGAELLAAARAGGHSACTLSRGVPTGSQFDVIALDGFGVEEVPERVAAIRAEAGPDVAILVGLRDEDIRSEPFPATWPVDDVYPSGHAGSFVLRLATAARRRDRHFPVSAADRLEQANDTIYLVDFEGRFTWANAAAETLTGYSRDELVGMSMTRLVAPEFHVTVRENIAAKLNGISPSSIFELDIIRADGERRRIELSSRVLHEKGRPVAIQGIARDLSEVRKLQAQLRREHRALLSAQAQMRAVFESSTEAVLVIGPDFRLILANARAREHARAFFGNEPAPGDHVRPWVTAREWPEFEQYVRRALAGEQFSAEWRRRAPNGEASWFESVYSPVLDDAGSPIAVAIVGRDVTHQRSLLIEIEQREAALSAVFASMNEGITLIDPEMHFVLANDLAIERAKLFTGHEPRAGGHMSEYVRKEDWETFIALFARALSGEHVTVSGRFDHPETGEPLWTEYNYQPVRDPNGEIVAVARVSRDVTKTHLAERALRAADRYNRALVENTPDSLFVLDVTGEPGAYAFSVAMVNSAFCRLTGFQAERIQGRPVEQVFRDPSVRGAAVGHYLNAIASGATVEYQETVPYGPRPQIHTSLTPLFDRHGRCYRIIGTSRDVSEQLRLEREERLARQRAEGLARIVESASDAIMSLDMDRRVTYWNPGAERTYGYTAGEVLGRTIDFIYPGPPGGESASTAAARLDRVYAGEAIVASKTQRTHKDGHAVDVIISAFPLRDAEGRVVGVASAATDMTDQLRAEAVARERTADLDAVFASSRDTLVLLDTEGRVLRMNPAAQSDLREVHGIDDITGRAWAEYMPVEGRPTYRQHFDRATAGEVVAFERQTTINGQARWFDVSYTAVRMEDGRIRGVLITGRDITERKRTTEALLQAQKLESLAVLAGGIAHDFNNLLVGILGNAGLALSELSPESPARPTVEAIELAGQRAAELARQMLAYSGRGKLVIQDTDLNHLVSEMTHLLKVSIGKRVALRLDLASQLPMVKADATQLRQVVMNLVVNASDAIGDRDGVISIRTASIDATAEILSAHYLEPNLPPGPYVLVEVTDTGEGMDPATLGRIFDPFFTTKFTGRGLGLAAVLGIVRGHHGAIKVESAPGEGTTFRLLLPATSTEVSPVTPKDANAPWKGSGVVLVVDDEPTVRTVTVRALQAFGFETLEAEDGQAGLDVYRENQDRVVAVLLDMTMPRMNGEQAFRALRDLNPDVRVVLMSGFTEQDAAGSFEGRAGFIQKPYELGALREAVRRAIEQSGQ